MIRTNSNGIKRLLAWLMVFAVFAMPVSVFSQTQIKYHSNKYKPTDDVKVGRQAAGEVEQQMPILNDNQATNYVSRVGQRLVSSIPPEFQHPEFSYYFKIVNASDINAFALPGGPMYVNRGMIEAAHSEGEMAGVMAHELSHVALRHGTAQASKAQKYGLLAGILGIGGQILGGPAGAAAQIAGQGVGVYFLKFSREYETEADILGAQIMARAGYDPRDLAKMFKTIEQQSGGGGGGFLSDHPSPKDRYARITQEAQYLRVENPIRESREFSQVQARLRGMGRASSMEEIARGNGYPNQSGNSQNGGYARTERVAYPSASYRTEGNSLFRTYIPTNWTTLGGEANTINYAPEGAYGSSGITHGVMFAADRKQYTDLERASRQLVLDLLQAQDNNYLRQVSGWEHSKLDGRNALTTRLSGRSPITNQLETVTLITAMLSTGEIFSVAAVAPNSEYSTYERTFDRIFRSVHFSDNY